MLELVPSGKQRNRVRVENGRRIRTVHDAHTPPVVASLSFNQVAVCGQPDAQLLLTSFRSSVNMLYRRQQNGK